jgi:hypothetical protein
MRIATTASPVSGAEVRDQMVIMTAKTTMSRFIRVLKTVVREYKDRKDTKQK